MASGDFHHDVDLELSKSAREVNLYVEELRGKMIKLYREKTQMENVQKRLIEISMEYYKSGEKDKDGISTRLIELKTEFYNIKDLSSSGLDLGIGSGSRGAGASQNDKKKSFLDREKEHLEDVEKRVNELSMECNQSGNKDKDGIWKRLEELKIELDIIKDIRSCSGLEFDLEVGSGIGGPGPSQDDPRKRFLDKEKEQLEAVEKKVNEFVKEYHQSDDSGKTHKEGLWKRLDELRTELNNVEDIRNSSLDFGVTWSGSGEAGPCTQDVGASISKSGGQGLELFLALLDFTALCSGEMNGKKKQQHDIQTEDQDLEEVSSSLLDLAVGQDDEKGCKMDTVETAGVEGNQSGESSNIEGGKDVFDVASDSTLTEGVFIEGLEVELKNFTQFLEEAADIENKFLDMINESKSSDFNEQPVSSDT